MERRRVGKHLFSSVIEHAVGVAIKMMVRNALYRKSYRN